MIVASKGGAPTTPTGTTTCREPVRDGGGGNETFDVTAEEAGPDERERLWAMITGKNRFFAEYERSTHRTIPVMILRRTEG